MYKILIIDDDARLVTNLTTYLKDFGYHIEAAYDGAEGLEKARCLPPDLILLDIMMPATDGLEVCRAIRRTSSVPIIMLTARSEEADVVAGLEVGADDYLTKPFSLREMAARIKAHLRRSSTGKAAGQGENTILTRQELTIDATRMEVFKRRKNTGQAERVNLTSTEFNLLWMMAAQPGVVFSRDKLLEELRNRELEAFDRSIDAHISHLRKKIEDSPKNPRHILTVWGVGYKFQDS